MFIITNVTENSYFLIKISGAQFIALSADEK